MTLNLMRVLLGRCIGGAVVATMLFCDGAVADPVIDYTSAEANQKLVVCSAVHTVISKRIIEAIAAGTDFYSMTGTALTYMRIRMESQAELDLALQRGNAAGVRDQYSNRVAAYSRLAPVLSAVQPLMQMSRDHCEPLFQRLRDEGGIRQEALDELEERMKPVLEAQVKEAMATGEQAAKAAKK